MKGHSGIRKDTKEKYEKFLINLATAEVPINLEQAISTAKIDVKIGAYLKSNKHVVIKEDGYIKTNFKVSDIKEIVDSFIEYREGINERYQQEKEDLAYYQKNKEFLVDIRKQKSQLSEAERDKIIKDTRDNTVKEVAKYAQLAIELGKKDIAKFIHTLLDTE